jgi:hypothetical protein
LLADAAIVFMPCRSFKKERTCLRPLGRKADTVMADWSIQPVKNDSLFALLHMARFEQRARGCCAFFAGHDKNRIELS